MNQLQTHFGVVLLLFCTISVSAQDESRAQPFDVQERLGNLESDLGKLRLRVDGFDRTTQNTLRSMEEAVSMMGSLQDRIDNALDRFKEYDDRIAANRDEIELLKKLVEESTKLVKEERESVKKYDQRINENLIAIENLQKEIRQSNETFKSFVKTDDEGRSQLDILGNMQNPTFKSEFTQAIEQLGFQRRSSGTAPGGNPPSGQNGNTTIGQTCPSTVRRVLRVPIGIDYSTGCTIYQEHICY